MLDKVTDFIFSHKIILGVQQQSVSKLMKIHENKQTSGVHTKVFLYSWLTCLIAPALNDKFILSKFMRFLLKIA